MTSWVSNCFALSRSRLVIGIGPSSHVGHDKMDKDSRLVGSEYEQ
jgi:hypothetical protein